MLPEITTSLQPVARITVLALCSFLVFPRVNAQTYTLSQSGTYNIEIDNPTFFGVNQDDATEIPIGFNFDFFGVTYTDCWVGGDGFISFGDYPDPSCCGQFIPDNNTPNNVIAVAWMNVDWISAHYEIFGTAPDRRLVITFDLLNPCDSSYYGQVKLFESTNIIEIHTQQWYGGECQGWNVTQGIENANGTVAIPVPGRNYNDTWQVNPGDDDFVSYTPAANPATTYIVSQTGTHNIESVNPTTFYPSQDGNEEIPIGFVFNFFGNSYTSCFVGSDGFLSFGADPGGGCCGQLIPDQTDPNNLIAVAWTNMDYIEAQYEVLGTAPYRRLLITYFMEDECVYAYYGQVKLFETTNVIEIHTEYWSANQTPCNPTTQGLENINGTEAIEVPGRNFNTDWTITEGDFDFVSFTPVIENEFEYYMEEANEDFQLEFSFPNDITIGEDSFAKVALDFPFEFFGTAYDSLFIAFNGLISFEEPVGGGCCEGQLLPDPNGPNNLIAAAWVDIATSGNGYNTYSYGTIGDAPNRKFVVDFYYDDACYGAYYHGQIHLLESDFSIEIHTDYWAAYGQPCTNTTQGIESPGGTNAYFLMDRNANTTWNVPCCGDMVRFTPLSSLPQADAGVSQIYTGPYCEGPELMSLLISNYGGQDISTVQVNWTWDGVLQDPVTYASEMQASTFNYYVPLDTQDLVFGNDYELKAWTSNPNGVGDDNPSNDTMTAIVHVGLHGDYTVGGTDPDFVTIQEAVDSLQSIGICDSTTILIRPGTYTEHVKVPNIPGVAVYPIVFTAENGDSSSVIVQYNAVYSDSNYVVSFDNAYNVTWEKMTLNALGTYHGIVIELLYYSQHNIIRHCAINGINTSSTDKDFACIYSKSINHHNLFLGNTVTYGSYSFLHEDVPIGIGGFTDNHVEIRGSGSEEDYVNEINLTGNRLLQFSYRGIRTTFTNGLTIDRNHIESDKNNVWGIQLNSEGDTLQISHNMMYLPSGNYGIWLSVVEASASGRAGIYNNMVSLPKTVDAIVGIGLHNCTYTDVYHNSIRLNSSSQNSYGYYHGGGGFDSISNNIFANHGGGLAIYIWGNSNGYVDYNNYFTTGPNIGFYNNFIATLEIWQTITGLDVHSISYNPLFLAPDDLHTTNSLINGRGSSSLSAPTDIDGEARNGTTPDPGADEFTPGAHDAAITEILSPSLICIAEQEIKVVLVNAGADTLHEATIQWTVNGQPQPDFLFTGTLDPQGDTAHVVIGTRVFTDQPDTLVIWSTMPDDSNDVQPANDTISLRFRLPFNGIYTIGGTDPDFPTIASAVAELNLFHNCGPVTFRIRDGVYTEQVIIDSIPTTSSTNTITFESESLDSSSVTIQFTPIDGNNASVIILKGTDHVIFRHLGIKALPSTWSNGIELKYSADNITVSHCYLEAYNFGSSCMLIRCLNFGGVSDSLRLEHNYFFSGQEAVYLYNGGGQKQQGIYIDHNTFLNQRYRGMDLSFTLGLYIRDNHIQSNTTNSYTGIDVSVADLYSEISGNTILLTNTGDGMFLNSMNYGYSTGTAHIFNNMVKTTGTGGGIRVWNSGRIYSSFNTCFAGGSGMAFEIVGGDTTFTRNNVFVSNTGTSFILSTFNFNVVSDYNDLFSISGNTGNWNGTLYPTLAEWQTGTTLDTHSMSIDPEFVSATDLHVLADTLDGAGIPISGITTDIDENPRNAITPDLGADEIGTNDDDAGVLGILPEMPFARGAQDVKAVIRNYGGNTITSLDIHWELNSVTQPVIQYTGSLPSLQQDTVMLDNVDFLLGTPYILKAWTTNPNTNPDYYNSNDTLLTGSRYAAVSDTVTIGGTSPDVPTIAAAVTALSLGGVLDSVHFQLRNGTYHYALSLPQTIGMNCNTPIIFESESGNPADVIWDNQSINNHTIVLDGADGITFKNLTIKTTNISYHAVDIRNAAVCNTIEGCRIEGMPTTSTGTGQATIFAYGANLHTNTIIGNNIKHGSYGLYWHGYYNTPGLIVRDNEVENAYYSGLTVAGCVSSHVVGNTISTNSNHSYLFGIQISECSYQTVVDGNKVMLSGERGVGIQIVYSNSISTQRGRLSNNYVNIGHSSFSYGIQYYGSNYWDTYHNTVRLSGGEPNGVALLYNYSTYASIINNIFDHRAGGKAIAVGGNSGPFTSNYNNLLTTGVHLIHYEGTDYTDLENWQTTNFDTNSISVDPAYVDDDGYAITSAALNAVATPLDSVPLDIDGEVRDTLTPDIGCDEFFLADDDVGILSINYPTEPFPSGENTVFIKFINNGQDTLVSMQVDWEVDSIPQPTYYWTGLLPSAGTYDSLDIGVFDFEPYQAHTIKVWVSLPNGVADELASNDTLTAGNLYPALLGTYTIGGNQPDFDSISIAVDALNQGGVAGDVIFQIRSGTYQETINLIDFPGSDCLNTVTFQSESGDSTDVIISNLGIDDNIVTLDGADGVIFQNLTLKSVNPAYRNVINYYNGAHCNQFLNNHLQGYSSTSTNPVDAVISSANSLDTTNTFAHNLIENGSIGFHLLSNGARTNTTIENNLFSNNYESGIFAFGESFISILNNELTGSSNTYYNGIQLEHCHGATRVEGNDIRCNSAYFILRMDYCLGMAGARGRVVNNFFSSNGTYGYIGVLINNAKRYDVLHNNISVNTNNASTAFYFHTDSSLTVTNNIIVNAGNGVIVYGNNQAALSSDYNVYHGSGSFGTWNGAGVADFAAWQTATTEDANSMDINPQYMSASDLHVSNILLNGAGIPIASVLTDIDGDTRDSIPDIGADEFDPSIANDAGVFMYMGPTAPFASGSQPVTVALKNYGYETLTSAEIRWIVNGIEQPVYEWTGSLGSAQCDTVVIGNYTFPEYTGHALILWSEVPNGVPDSTHVNDTIAVEDIYPALSGTYTVGGLLPDFNLFIQLEKALNKGGILDDVTFNVRNGTYSTQLVIENFPRNNYLHQITFQSESGDSSLVIIRKDFYQPSTNYTILLSDAHHITFDQLTLASTQGRILEIANESSHITIEHCRFKGVDVPYIYAHQLIYSNTTTEDTIYIVGNRFEEGDYGIYLTASGGNTEKEVVIENNYFYNVRYRSIHTSFHEGLKIKDNTIFNNQCDHEGIAIIASYGTKEISGNDIRLLQGGSYGMYLQDVQGTSAMPTKIYNNYILIRNWAYNAYGIHHSYGNYNNFHYNTVRLENTGAGSVAFGDYQSNFNIHFRNCILANYSGGLTIQNSWYSGYTNNTMDYCDLFTTGPVLAQYYSTYNTLTALQTGTSQHLHSISAEPLFANDDAHIFQAACEGTAIPIAGILTDIEGEARHATDPDIGCDEFTLLAHDIGAKLLVSPATYCGLSNAEEVTIRIQNYGSSAETGFNVAYSVNGSGWTVENVGALNVAPGGTGDYTFAVIEDLSEVGIYEFALRTALPSDLNLVNDTLWEIEVEHIPALVEPVSNMIPTDGEIDLDRPVSLSWAPAPNATVYDVYIWQDGGSQPGTPQITNLTQINTSFNDLSYGTSYHWRVVAKNICNQMVNGPIHQFTIRDLPDIVTDTVIAPPTAFSGEEIEIEWQTKNNGPGSTESQVWSDAVYLSTDATLNLSFDTYLGAIQNLTSLDSGVAYTNTGTFMIPNGYTGNYYVFVYSDRWNNLLETQNNNNWERTPSTMMITLSPTPDIKVITVAAPTTTFSGQTISINATIKNIGTGPTQISTWHDRVYFGSDPLNYGTGQYITTIQHNGILEVDSTYSIQANVTLPQGIFGERYVYVVSDYFNTVFENAAESNNVGISDTIDVILTPPADLYAYDLVYPDTIHNNQLALLNYSLINQGGSTISNSSWYDHIYISQAPVYNTNFLTYVGSVSNYGPMMPNDPTIRGMSFVMPNWASGPYYFYVILDKGQHVFEHTLESNNTIRSSGTFYVANPDMITDNLVFPATATAGQTASVSWNLINGGPGNMFSRYWQTKIYLSTDAILNTSSDILVKTLHLNTNVLAAQDTLMQSTVIPIPNGLSGTYYIHVLADAVQQIYEDGNESNNTGTSSTTMQINLPPHPDLRSREIQVPDTIVAGEAFPLVYEAANIGQANATASTTDSFFLSFSPSWNPITNLAIGRKTGLPTFSFPDSSTVNAILATSTQQTSNIYYLYIKSDATAAVYEYLGESNNIQRSGAFFIAPAPEVDLQLDTFIVNTDTVFSGTSFNASWIVTNISDGYASNAGWRDALYLSVDSIFNPELDIRFYDTQAGAGGLAADAFYMKTATPVIPNGLQGNYYILAVTDDYGVNSEEDTLNNINSIRNNGLAVRIHIELSPSPDLRPVLFSAPTTAYSGQPFTLIWNIQNDGNGAAQTWNDKVYLSTDNIINQGDILLNTSARLNLNLLPAGIINDTVEVFVNSQLQGNYILILKTDADQTIYEHLGESNNQINRSITFTAPPPCDLTVTSILLPDSTIAGSTISISWNTLNSGTNPTNGILREIVYLSSDDELDVDDRLFGLEDLFVYIPPGSSVSRTMSADVSGVSQGDYFALVQTDARDNVTENNDTNNISASNLPVNVSIEELYLDSLTVDSFYNGQEHYFRLEIPLSEQGQNLRVTIDGDSLGQFTEMYIKYGDAPTLSDFEYKHLYPFAQDQELLLEGLVGGTYYLMFKGHTTHASGQRTTILARIIDFELLSIAPEKGLNRGQTTIELLGTQMDTMRRVYLVRDSTVRILADTIYEINSFRAFATFNLEGQPPGFYTVQAIRWDGKIAELIEAFEIIEEGEESDLQIIMDYPGVVGLRNGPMKITIFIQNAGDQDLVNKTFLFEAPWGNLLANTYEDLISGNTQTTLEIPVQGAFGPPGILPPKAGNTIEVFAYSRPNPTFTLTPVDE